MDNLYPQPSHPARQPAQRGNQIRHATLPFRGQQSFNSNNGNNRDTSQRLPWQNLNVERCMHLGISSWRTWPELTIRIQKLPPDTTTHSLHGFFKEYGNVIRIDMYDDVQGIRTGEAEVTFSPPPSIPVWEDYEIWEFQRLDKIGRIWVYKATISLKEPKRNFFHPSPVDPRIKYQEKIVLRASTLEFGFLYKSQQMMIMRTIDSSKSGDINFTLSLLHREIVVDFTAVIPCIRDPRKHSQDEIVKFQIPLRLLDTILEVVDTDVRSLIINLDKPPVFFGKLEDMTVTHDEGRHWNEKRGWVRMSKVQHTEDRKLESPIGLQVDACYIDIGRWTSYKLTFRTDQIDQALYNQARNAMKDYNIPWLEPKEFQTIPESSPSVWNLLDKYNPEFVQPVDWRREFEYTRLPWTVGYQLESCISQGYLNEHNIDAEFIQKLTTLKECHAILKLEMLLDKQKRLFNPSDIFNLHLSRRYLLRKVPKHCILQRSAIVTPTTIYFSAPTVEMSNRILRKYQQHADRFLRVRFTDEKHKGRLNAVSEDGDASMDALFNRIYRCLTNGITVGDRHFEFLACGNSQFRENGAYFFASLHGLTAETIRQDMGDFSAIKVVAKYASRLGQCFSTTRGIHTRLKLVEIADIKRNTFTFTDGVGKISHFAAALIVGELGHPTGKDIPSLLQFRMGGSKGVVAVSPDVKGREIHIRPSQYKFPAIFQGFEIIRCSSFSTPRLNRQLIAVLKSLRIPDAVFLSILNTELEKLELAMTDDNEALQLLQQQIDFNQMSLEVASIVFDGFVSQGDPFAVSVLRLWRSFSLKQLKEKAALPVLNGAFLLGCTDETATLKGYFDSAQPRDSARATQQERAEALPEIFVRISDLTQKSKYRVVEGLCIVARNPSLHPGDIRVVRAVDNPLLHHLKNVVVFPQTGDKDIPSMCSGGDLDGDDFVVIWDDRMIPPDEEWNVPAMDFTAPVPETVDEVNIKDVVGFFCRFMKADRLRTIATWHLANADRLEGGVRHLRCIELAKEHSVAVDFPKSGVPSRPHPSLRPQNYPHFMPNQFRAKSQYYKSTTILGQLYDRVPDYDFQPLLDMTFDDRILKAYKNNAVHQKIMSDVKAEYDATLRQIMAQHEIATEFEVWTTWVMDHARVVNDYKIHEEVGRISSALKEQFVGICHRKAGVKDFQSFAPWLAAMYTVTAREAGAKLEELKEQYSPAELAKISPQKFPLISFPWLFHRDLGRIARGKAAAVLSMDIGTIQTMHKPRRKIHDDLEGLQFGAEELVTSSGVAHHGDTLIAFSQNYTTNGGDLTSPRAQDSNTGSFLDIDVKSVPKDITKKDASIVDADAAKADMIDAAINGSTDDTLQRPHISDMPFVPTGKKDLMEITLGAWGSREDEDIFDGAYSTGTELSTSNSGVGALPAQHSYFNGASAKESSARGTGIGRDLLAEVTSHLSINTGADEEPTSPASRAINKLQALLDD